MDCPARRRRDMRRLPARHRRCASRASAKAPINPPAQACPIPAQKRKAAGNKACAALLCIRHRGKIPAARPAADGKQDLHRRIPFVHRRVLREVTAQEPRFERAGRGIVRVALRVQRDDAPVRPRGLFPGAAGKRRFLRSLRRFEHPECVIEIRRAVPRQRADLALPRRPCPPFSVVLL